MPLKNLYKILKTVTLSIALALLLFSCKTAKSPVVVRHDLNVKDTLIRHEVESIVLPQRNYVVFENPCKENELIIGDQVIENESSSISIKEVDQNLVISVDIDSIVNARLSEARIKSEVERIEIPVEVKVPVRNPINLRLVIALVAMTVFAFRKFIWFGIKKLINPLPI